jgi:hypothetical protein
LAKLKIKTELKDNGYGMKSLLSLAIYQNAPANPIHFQPVSKYLAALNLQAMSIDQSKPLSLDARSFVTIGTEKEGLIYKNPLPNDGMILSGSKIITDRFNLRVSLD